MTKKLTTECSSFVIAATEVCKHFWDSFGPKDIHVIDTGGICRRCNTTITKYKYSGIKGVCNRCITGEEFFIKSENENPFTRLDTCRECRTAKADFSPFCAECAWKIFMTKKRD